MELENLQDGSKKMKKCKNITFCHFFAFGGPCDVQKRVKVYKVCFLKALIVLFTTTPKEMVSE